MPEKAKFSNVPLFLYIAKFSLLGLLYLAVYFAYRQVFRPLSRSETGLSTERFQDVDPGRLWIVPSSGGDQVTPSEGMLCETPLIIGRGADCDLTIKNPFTSLRHVRIVPHSTHCELEDLETANGTLLESAPVQGKVLLEEGSCFNIGDVSFRLVRKAD